MTIHISLKEKPRITNFQDCDISSSNRPTDDNYRSIARFIYGLSIISIMALSAIWISNIDLLKNFGISPFIIAIVLGIFVSNTFTSLLNICQPAIKFSIKRVLRLAIILLGFGITFQQIVEIGWQGIFVDIFMLGSTFYLAWYVGRKVYKLDRDTTLLIGAGSSICGASAVLATEGILRADTSKAVVAVGTVTLFGTIAMFLYPFLFTNGFLPDIGDKHYGIFVGATIHEVAQVTAAGYGISEVAGENAVVTKLARVMLLAPTLILLSYLLVRKNSKATNTVTLKNVTIPWFVIGFIIVSGFYSLNIVPEPLVTNIQSFNLVLLTIAMTALGFETRISKIKKAGITPILLGLILFIWLFSAGLLATLAIN